MSKDPPMKLTVDTSFNSQGDQVQDDTLKRRQRVGSKMNVSPLYDQVNHKTLYKSPSNTTNGHKDEREETETYYYDEDGSDGFFDQFAFASTPSTTNTTTNNSTLKGKQLSSSSSVDSSSQFTHTHRHSNSAESSFQHKRSTSRGSIHEYATNSSKSFFKFFKKNTKDTQLSGSTVSLPMNSNMSAGTSPVSPVASVSSKFSKRNSFDKRKLSPLIVADDATSDGNVTPSSKKKLSRSSSLLRTHRTSNPKQPKSATFEKLGPVGKLPSPVGITIPVTTTSTIHFNDDLVNQTHPKLEPPLPSELKPIKTVKSNPPILTKSASTPPIIEKIFLPKVELNKRFILITTNHREWKSVDISKIEDVAQFKTLLTLDENSQLFLTNFGLSKDLLGQPLNDDTLKTIVNDFKTMEGVNYKFYISFFRKIRLKRPEHLPPFLLEPIEDHGLYNTTSHTNSINSESSLEKFLSTPQHLISTKRDSSIDYLNFKEFQDRKPSLTRARSITHSSVTSTPPPLPISNPDSGASGSGSNSHSNDPSTPIDTARTNSSTFRVIQPDTRFVDFDNKRPTPFASTSNLSTTTTTRPKRNPPPPPSPGLSVMGSISSKNSSSSIPKISRRQFHNSIKQLNRSNTQNSLFSVNNNNTNANIDPFLENEITFKFDDSDDCENNGKDGQGNFGNDYSNETSSDDDDDDDDDFGLFSKKPESIELNIRPPPEVLYNNLEVFFPQTDLDKLIINDGIQRMKSIRIIAQEAASQRIQNGIPSLKVTNSNSILPPSARLRSGTTGSILRRRSTKMWGQKVFEVQHGQKIETKRDRNGVIKEFAWIKGALIGVGKFGRVYIAMNITTGDLIAVKQMNNENTSFKREINSLRDLDHMNIVQYLGYEISDVNSSIFLEYVSGGSIGHLLRKYGKLDEPIIRFLTIQMFEGLNYIHSKGLLHCDLKADNLLLETNGVLKISDFGISKRTKDLSSQMAFQGTIFWMAPEIIDDQNYDSKVDIWSSGCVLIEMFTGDRPWKTFEIEAVLYKLGKEKIVPPIPKDIRNTMDTLSKDFLRLCLQINPQERPTADELLKNEFCKSFNSKAFKFEDTQLAKQMNQVESMESNKLATRMKSIVRKM